MLFSKSNTIEIFQLFQATDVSQNSLYLGTTGGGSIIAGAPFSRFVLLYANNDLVLNLTYLKNASEIMGKGIFKMKNII